MKDVVGLRASDGCVVLGLTPMLGLAVEARLSGFGAVDDPAEAAAAAPVVDPEAVPVPEIPL